MDGKFTYTDPESVSPVVFEQIFAEVPGGAVVAEPDFYIPASTALGYDADNKLRPIKAYRLTEPIETADTTIQIAKGSGIKVGDIIATGKKGVAVTAVDSSSDEFDVVTVTLGVALATGSVLYQAKSASASAAFPIYTPIYILGEDMPTGEGDLMKRLINGANLRKETANVSDEVVALMKSIEKV